MNGDSDKTWRIDCGKEGTIEVGQWAAAHDSTHPARAGLDGRWGMRRAR